MAFDPYASSASKKGNGSRFATFDWGTKKVEFYKIKDSGDYAIDIIPFKIASKKHPATHEGAAVGDEVYNLDYYLHRNVGPKQMTVICPAETLGKPCPICEAAERAKREFGPQSKEFASLKPKHNVMYNVVDPEDKDEKIKIFDVSFALFEQALIETAGAKGRRKGKDFIRFGNIEEGWSVSFTANQESFMGAKYFKFTAFDLDQREEPHSKSLIKEAYSLDEYMIVKSYEELEALMTGDADVDDDEPEEDSPPSEEKAEASSPSKKESGDPKCPAGKKYGKDFDRDSPDCDQCDNWRECKKLTRESKD